MNDALVLMVGCLAFFAINFLIVTGPVAVAAPSRKPRHTQYKSERPPGALVERLRQIHHDETPIFARLAEELGIDLAGFRPLDGAVA
ncbi:hypothetical protein [Mycolicibacter kumamotonensis]|uniref:Uncharacterized protein n=1 Tax=Mycolicibacter kumamotonensis TaxID=354243 RepID=A0A1B8SLA1_9MYCO|nr:hypothetical protein [Mycolicibacter kumamotonensis]OBY33508.1 hypothetical protein ACT18_00765 [Mycolicibacter kumamotonensis]